MNGITAGGSKGAVRSACWQQAKAEVWSRNAAVLGSAGPLRRWWLKLELRREVRRRFRELMPPVSSRSCF